jgi:uncharacterized cofD-like protein
VLGQVAVSETGGSITCVSIVPPDAAVPAAALEAIAEAEQVVIGPGSLYTSVLAVAAVPGIRDALAERRSGRVYVCNLRPQLPETAGLDEAGHLQALLDHGVPVDAMVTSGEAATYEIAGVRVVRAPIARPDGRGHDPEGLAAVLARLT